jgi:hypothetical protein
MAPARGRKRGSIEGLPSGALRVAVRAGLVAVTGRRYPLREIIPVQVPLPIGPPFRGDVDIAEPLDRTSAA